MDRIKITLLILLLISFRLHGQVDNTNDLIININQRILPGSEPDILYEIKNRRINIFKIDSFSRFKLIKKKKIYSDRFDDMFIDKLKYKIDSLNINNLNDFYSSNLIDGVWWMFIIKTDRFKKEISLDNYYLPEIGLILDYINDKLPERKRLIRFEYLEIKDKFLKDK